MSTGEIVIEERLRSTGLAVVNALLVVVVVSVCAIGASMRPAGSAPLVIIIVGSLATLFLLCAFLAALRIVVRVVETAQGRELVVVYGPGGLVRQVFGPEQIVSASVQGPPRLMAGWGYQGSLKLLRQAAVITRRGTALQVALTGKRRFSVSVDDPDAFVAALAPAVGGILG
jgi:hypothetical protein